MADNFTMLFNSILTSSIWGEDDKTRILWITMLALSDYNGKVEGSVPGLATMARISLPDCEAALLKLESPDPYSRTKEHEGRRIRAVEGGWIVLNKAKNREKRASRADYYRKWRAERTIVRNQFATSLQPLQHGCATDKDRDKDKELYKEKEINKEKERIVFFLSIFDRARIEYPGVKRGLQTEFDLYRLHPDWRESIELLEPAVVRMKSWRKHLKATGQFCPTLKHFKTWIANRCWEEEYGTAPETRSTVWCTGCRRPKEQCTCRKAT
jgi:hypothetical protein